MLTNDQIKTSEKYCYVMILRDLKILIISNVKYKILKINKKIGLIRMEYKNLELWKYIGSSKEMYWTESSKELKEFISSKEFSLYKRSYLVADTMNNNIISVEKK